MPSTSAPTSARRRQATLANASRVATVHILDHHDLVKRFVKTARALREFIRENIGEPGHGAVASVVDLFLRDHGDDPRTAIKPAPARAATNTVGSPFAGLPNDQ